MFKVNAIPALTDNYIWVIHHGSHAIVIDVGEDKPVADYLSAHGLDLCAILITHHHHDHTGGVAGLLKSYPNCQVFAHHAHGVSAQAVDEGDEVQILDLTFKVWRTAGHTDTHLSYLLDIKGKTHVFCGDTLFSGGCGRVFTGTMRELYDSMMRFDTLPSDTLFYPAHEYTLANLAFGAYIEPHNEAIKQSIAHAKECKQSNTPTLPTSLVHEWAVNVFLREYETPIKDRLIALGRIDEKASEFEVFEALRLLKNDF